MSEISPAAEKAPVVVRPLAEADLNAADRIFRVAFGTHLGLSDPGTFFGDADAIHTRWRANPHAALGAVLDGELVGSNFAANWGSVGFFGPVTVAPVYWDRGVAHGLIESAMELFASWETHHIGLFTFADSPKHVGLYQKFGFRPRFLTAVMARPVSAGAASGWRRLSGIPAAGRPSVMNAIRDLTDAVYPGLDLSIEVDAVRKQHLGDTVLIEDNDGLVAMAVCHLGPGSEGGTGTCFVKFGAVRPGRDALRMFGVLIDACNQLAAEHGASTLLAGMNAGRDRAWDAIRAHGFRATMQGVAMHRQNEPGYSTRNDFVIDDWR